MLPARSGGIVPGLTVKPFQALAPFIAHKPDNYRKDDRPDRQ
jgi:hypothetical protein